VNVKQPRSAFCFRTGELEGCVEMFEHFHNSTISLSKVVRVQYQVKLFYFFAYKGKIINDL
jgi:hypothetical protein